MEDPDNLKVMTEPKEESSAEDVKKEEVFEDETKSDKKGSYPMRETVIGPMRFNMVSSLIGICFLWGLAIYCMARPDDASTLLKFWKSQCTKYFTWLFIGANPVFTFFCVFLAFRFGNIKLGSKDDKPEFSDVTYFAMIFSAGVGVGLFFYGVSEPLWHQNSTWFAEAGYRGQDEIDQWALMITCYHWGFAGWSPYLILGISAALASYRFGLPMTVRSSLYPLLGEYTWGWIGDVIDGFSIVTTVAGICTSLGLGAMQIVAGLQRLGWVDSEPTVKELMNTQVAVVWVVTVVASVSVVSGLHNGIKVLSQIGFSVGMLLLFLCLVMEKTYFLFNLMVQTIGYYFQWSIFQVPFWTDAFGQLNPGEGRAVDGKEAPTWWMDAWTVFYMAWWGAWACFVGLFIARISKGRTIREVVFYCFFAPMLYCFIWFGIFGGIGLRQARQALELKTIGEDSFDNPSEFLVEGSSHCYHVPQEDVVVNGTTVFTNNMLGITPVCEFDSSQSTQAWFNVMYSFSYPNDGFLGFGPFMSGLSLFALTIYFITSSDSGSLVVDHLASNGQEDHHWIQRIFWAFTEGAVATALLVSGGSGALSALQAASIVFGLPFTVFLFLMCASIYQMCCFIESEDKSGGGETRTLPKPERSGWLMPIYGGIFNIIEFVVSLGSVHQDRVDQGMHLPTMFQVIEFFKGAFLPFVSLYQIYSLMDLKGSMKLITLATTVVYAAMFLIWIALFASTAINDGFLALGWSAFFINACILTNLRMTLRGRFSISGNVVGDFFASSFVYPQALCQMLLQLKETSDDIDHEA